MKNLFAIRPSLFLSGVVLLGLAALQVFDGVPPAGADSREGEAEQLFREMLVIKITQASDPFEARLIDTDGRPVSLSDFRGKIVFLNFWTTWCPSCRIEMPSMEKLHQQFKDSDFAMVSVNLQESASRVKEFLKEYKLTFAALLDTSGEVGIMFGIYQIPTTYILDKKGRVIGKALGPREWDSKKSIALFEHLTNRQAATFTSDLLN